MMTTKPETDDAEQKMYYIQFDYVYITKIGKKYWKLAH